MRSEFIKFICIYIIWWYRRRKKLRGIALFLDHPDLIGKKIGKLDEIWDLDWPEIQNIQLESQKFLSSWNCDIAKISGRNIAASGLCDIKELSNKVWELSTLMKLSSNEKSKLNNLIQLVKNSDLDLEFTYDRLKKKDLPTLRANINNPEKYIDSFKGGKYDVLIKDKLLDFEFLPIIDYQYVKGKGFLDQDFEFSDNKLEIMQWDYIFVVQKWEMIFSKKFSEKSIRITHADLWQGSNVDFAWEINFQWGMPESFNNKSWHYHPWERSQDVVKDFFDEIWYDHSKILFTKE